MTQENSPQAPHTPPTIPVGEILDWYQGEQQDIERQRERLANYRATAGAHGVDIRRDIENARFGLNGRVEELNGFAAFLLSRGVVLETMTDTSE